MDNEEEKCKEGEEDSNTEDTDWKKTYRNDPIYIYIGGHRILPTSVYIYKGNKWNIANRQLNCR